MGDGQYWVTYNDMFDTQLGSNYKTNTFDNHKAEVRYPGGTNCIKCLFTVNPGDINYKRATPSTQLFNENSIKLNYNNCDVPIEES